MEGILTRTVALQRHTERNATGTECVAEMRKKAFRAGYGGNLPFSHPPFPPKGEWGGVEKGAERPPTLHPPTLSAHRGCLRWQSRKERGLGLKRGLTPAKKQNS